MKNTKLLWGIIVVLAVFSIVLGICLNNTIKRNVVLEIQSTMLLNNMCVYNDNMGKMGKELLLLRLDLSNEKFAHKILQEKYDTLLKATQFDRAKSDL